MYLMPTPLRFALLLRLLPPGLTDSLTPGNALAIRKADILGDRQLNPRSVRPGRSTTLISDPLDQTLSGFISAAVLGLPRTRRSVE